MNISLESGCVFNCVNPDDNGDERHLQIQTALIRPEPELLTHSLKALSIKLTKLHENVSNNHSDSVIKMPPTDQHPDRSGEELWLKLCTDK